jgi:hypothetical protein
MLLRSPFTNWWPTAMQMLVVGEELFGAGHVAGRAFQFNAVGAQIDVDVQAVFEHVKIFIARAEEGFDVRGECNIFFHAFKDGT